tara:strand:+ start:7994 stop:8422 length:429 start_codon:yes stop_codon:yes gene_type:complete
MMRSFVNFLRENVYFGSSDVQGTGAFSSRDIPKGNQIGLFLRKVEDNPHRTFVRSDLCRLMNHSSSPNADLVMKGDDAYVVSNKPIKKDEEIFVNYNDIMDKVQADEIKKNEFVRLYPDLERERLEDDNEDFYDDLKSMRHK